MATLELAGQRFERLTALRRLGKRKEHFLWLCRCDCGNVAVVVGPQLKSGRTKSCGCLGPEQTALRSTTHGLTGHALYATWKTMRGRCNNPRHSRYRYYGARGIRVCERWDDFASFLSDMGPRPDGHTLDRIDNEGDYEPTNCRWATWQQQRANRRSLA